MSIFPSNGVPPSEAVNAYDPTNPPCSGDVRYFGSECGAQITDAWLNCLISEFVCVFNACPDFCYDPNSTCNLRDAIICLAAGTSALTCPDVFTGKTTYYYTGSDQTFLIPASAKYVSIKSWGAGGGNSSGGTNNDENGATGGFAEACFAASELGGPGSNLAVVVGEGGPSKNSPQTTVYGFGGVGNDSNGGGLSGVFTGTGVVQATDAGRGIVIAGGGGGGRSGPDNAGTPGGSAGTSGGQPTMLGGNGDAGGGGGLEGGAFTTRGYGGSSGVLLSSLSQQLLFTPASNNGPTSPVPGDQDACYVSPYGSGSHQVQSDGDNGLVVIQWA